MKKLKNFVVRLLSAVSILAAVAMVLVGFSDRLDPTAHPVLACAGMLFPFFVIINVGVLVFWLFVGWRRAIIPIAGLVLCYQPIRTFFPLHFGSETPDDGLKVMSYNVCGYNHKGRHDQPMDTIMSYLRSQRPDIVCLQEDFRHKPDPVGQLKEIFPYNDTVHVQKKRDSDLNALGVHSRFPIVKKERIVFESSANCSAAFFLLVDGDTVLVVNNHLESFHLSQEDRQHYKNMLKGQMERDSANVETRFLIDKLSKAQALRAPQARAVSDYIERHRHLPVIVCGDFNDTPISYARRTVGKGLTDCYVEAGCGPGLSYNQKGFNFRIDHIMCSGHFVPYRCVVDDKMGASDHYPVICWLKKVEKT